jgi:hypothetical protein
MARLRYNARLLTPPDGAHWQTPPYSPSLLVLTYGDFVFPRVRRTTSTPGTTPPRWVSPAALRDVHRMSRPELKELIATLEENGEEPG